ncbi:DUF3857 domain-containing protein [Flavivirga aquimarina]|uniref:DUF3857 domain-containing protein n=1 Tax=Flavivirga aquimarina TaxID=2027862 RepID=A0ABT8WDA6_9FLAO|nr:DUF3857 domain-containing protein [Flavivirga aquimarina]MDO5971033.1 DUF3857 domain-containing protein [Flavivirga aquimarina]
MMKKYILIILCFSFNLVLSQNQYDTFWNSLLNNDRASAKTTFKNLKTEDIKGLVINEILREENGQFVANESFINKFLSQKDFEYYLYALWNKTYFFDTYLATGLNEKNKRILKEVSKADLSNNTIKDAITYLNSIFVRHENDWKTYFELNNSIKVIKDWQFCGVFENLNKSGLDRNYEPEALAYSKNDFDAKSNGFVNWYKAKNTREAYQFFSNHDEFGAGVNYAQTFISTEKDRRITLRIGCGSAFKVWLNDVLLYENQEDVITELDAYKLNLTIPKGDNRLLIKLAESNSLSYFIAKATDTLGNEIEGLKYSADIKEYRKSTHTQIKPVFLTNEFEDYFKNKVEKFPNDFFYTYCLSNTYLRNSKYKEAKEVLQPFVDKYPKSSLVRKMLMTIYSKESDNNSYNELKKNLELDDPDYYLPMILKVVDYKGLSRMSMKELEAFLNKLRKTVNNEMLHLAADFVYNARKEDMSGVRKNLDDLTKLSKHNLSLRLRYIPLYSTLFKEDDKTISLLEDINEDFSDMSATLMLSRYYDKQNKKNKVIKLLSKDIDYLNNDNTYLLSLIKKLHAYQMYKESMPYIEMALHNFQYSFQILELKGDALVQQNKIDEAIKAYEYSLKFNSAKSSLRKKIKDLKNEPNVLDDFVIKDVYSYIEKNRKKIESNNYGYNILLDDCNIELYSEGGGKYRFTFVYEITSDSGVETFKEYDLGLSGSYYISKSEIVKSDKSVVPAEKSGSNLVFNGLSVGDIVHIDYESSFSSTGRFYKDFTDNFMFNSFHPTLKSSLNLIVPKKYKLHYKVVNGNLEPTISQIGNFDVYNWTVNNLDGLSQTERYMPNAYDVARYLHISTISDWNEISEWYSDLVRSSIEETTVVKNAFNEIFPEGFLQLTEDERAKVIYNYIKNNFTYSYVSFKQSGFVPQKPTKTIKTNLGDCKDFSTLFVTLANMAELKSNLVLILTSDNGQNNLVLPGTGFNHCIVKVKIDGKDQFLELTDKYLPYKSLPTSLRDATGLEIPFKSDSDKKYDLFKLNNINRDRGSLSNDVDVIVKSDKIKMKINTIFKGHLNSYYAEILSEPNLEVVKKSVFDDLNSQISEDFVLDKLYNAERVDNDKVIKYTSDITINKKANKIGPINILQLPKVSNPYTNDIISLENRKYPIEYIQYENLDEYSNTYNIFINEGLKFIEIPKSNKFTFKKHSYAITYSLIKDNHLRVTMHAETPSDNISVKDYNAFKSYVKSILEAEQEFIGYR